MKKLLPGLLLLAAAAVLLFVPFSGRTVPTVPSQPDRNLSPFNSEHWASESIWVAWNSCFTNAKERNPNLADDYCACATDRMRKEGVESITRVDLEKCQYGRGRFGLHLPDLDLKEGDGWYTSEILEAIAQCQSTTNYANANMRWAYCACLVDWRRSQARTFPEEKVFAVNHNPNLIDTCIRRAARYEPKPLEK
jgi:hypothetical protein